LLPESDPYHPWEKRFLSDPGCMPRYCRAAKWKMDNAKERIKGTLEWRREFKPDLIKPDHVKIVSYVWFLRIVARADTRVMSTFRKPRPERCEIWRRLYRPHVWLLTPSTLLPVSSMDSTLMDDLSSICDLDAKTRKKVPVRSNT